MRIYKFVHAISPKVYREWISSHLGYCDFTISSEKFVGFTVLYGLFLGFTVGFILLVLNYPIFFVWVWSLITFVVFQIFMYGILVLVSDERKKFAEEVLPDVLQLMAANIRSGITPDKALLLSARPEFGLLEVEIKNAAKKTIAGETLENALNKIGQKINSEILNRTLKLINEGIRKGGELADLLEQTAEDIRNSKILRREVSAYVLMYAIFIFFATAVGAPLLYAISTYLVETMTKVGGLVQVKEVFVQRQTGLMKFGQLQISSEFLQNYSLISLTITSIFGGMLIGLINEGEEKAGLKYVPVLLLLSIGIFFACKVLIKNMFGVFFV